MEYYMDDDKISHYYSTNSSCNKPSMSRSVSQKSSSTTTTRSSLPKSYSQKNNPIFMSNLSRSSSKSSSSLSRSTSQKCSEFTKKCSRLAKEQKAKFYIVKRCISLLVGFKKNGADS